MITGVILVCTLDVSACSSHSFEFFESYTECVDAVAQVDDLLRAHETSPKFVLESRCIQWGTPS